MKIQVNGSAAALDDTTVFAMSILRFESDPSWTGPTTAWQDTMSAHECALELSAWAFSNWSYVGGDLKRGTVAHSALNHTAGEDTAMTMVHYSYEARNPDFPRGPTGNQGTYVLSSLDKAGVLQNLERLFGTGYTADSLYQTRDDIPAALDDFATGLTYSMMTGPNATLADGLVLEDRTYVRVRWPWLALCAVMVVASAVLLAVTVVETRRADIRPWKSSLAPLVFADSSLAASHGAGSLGRLGKGWSDEHKSQRTITIKQVLA